MRQLEIVGFTYTVNCNLFIAFGNYTLQAAL